MESLSVKLAVVVETLVLLCHHLPPTNPNHQSLILGRHRPLKTQTRVQLPLQMRRTLQIQLHLCKITMFSASVYGYVYVFQYKTTWKL